MSKGVGGYVRRCERVQGTIEHLVPDCPWCGVPYTSVHLGTAQHAMEMHPHYSLPPLRFEPFDVKEPIDPGPLDAVRSWYEQRQRTKRPDQASD